MFLQLFFAVVILCLATTESLYAKVTTIPEVVVEGEATVEDKGNISVKSETLPSSVYVITKEDIEKMSVRHYLDVFRKSPGMITSHYGQAMLQKEGKTCLKIGYSTSKKGGNKIIPPFF